VDDARVALVTGTSRGIGHDLASHLLQHGWHVVGVSRTTGPLVHPRFEQVQADVTESGAAQEVTGRVRARYGRLDALINNAGVASMNHALLTPPTVVEQLMRVNYLAPFVWCQAAARVMAQRKWGRIVNLTSVAVPLRLAGEAAYASSKAALNALGSVLARELAPLGITVNAVGPTVTRTQLTRGIPDDKLQALLNQQAIPRMCTSVDIFHAVNFFLQPEADMVTGQVVYLGGP